MSWDIDLAVATAQLQATVAFADTGTGTARIRLYTNAWPGAGDPGQPAQAEIVLGKPCASVSGGVLSFNLAADPGGLVMTAGIPRWARWVSASGARIADGTVTDAAHGGDFRISGGSTPPGEDSPMLLAGSLAVLTGSSLS